MGEKREEVFDFKLMEKLSKVIYFSESFSSTLFLLFNK